MARRVFFSFHFEQDIFRVNQVRNSNVVLGVEVARYYDHSEYEEAKLKGDAAIKRMILDRLHGTSVTVVLIGTQTASRRWVQYEIEESIRRGNGMVGIQIHHLRAPLWNGPGAPWLASSVGPTPYVPGGVEMPVYRWDPSNVPGFARVIEEAGRRGDELRARRARAAAAAEEGAALKMKPMPVINPFAQARALRDGSSVPPENRTSARLSDLMSDRAFDNWLRAYQQGRKK